MRTRSETASARVAAELDDAELYLVDADGTEHEPSDEFFTRRHMYMQLTRSAGALLDGSEVDGTLAEREAALLDCMHELIGVAATQRFGIIFAKVPAGCSSETKRTISATLALIAPVLFTDVQ